MKPFLRSVSWCLFLLSAYCCSTNNGQYYESLASIDHILNEQPKAALDSLLSLDSNDLHGADQAYYDLLITIAYHKNRLPFQGDSAIARARKWFDKYGKDPHKSARAHFYHGLVLNNASFKDTSAFHLLREALTILDKNHIQDDKLEALAYAYLAKAHELNINLPEAAYYYRKAIEKEERLDNTQNLIIDQCNLLTCLVKMDSVAEACILLESLDSTLVVHPEFQNDVTDNAKAIFYLNGAKDLDSALLYCQRWRPHPSNIGAKNNMLAVIYRQKGQLDSAIFWEKSSYAHARPSDSLYRHIYYRHLANDYDQLGNADSAAHYALMAYQALYEQQERRTEKRILQLEKQYDLSAREAELERARYRQNLLTVIVAALLLLTGGLVFLVRNRNRKLRAEQVTRSIIQASAKTHQNTLSQLKPLCVKRKSFTADELQSELGRITTNLRKGFTQNFSDAIEKNRQALTLRQQEILQQLSGERAKTVFLLDELGYTEEEIAEYTCTSIDSVRVTKNNIRRVVQKQD